MLLGQVLSPPRPLVLLAASGLLLGAGCSNDSPTETSVTHPTMIEVAPEMFFGNVPCTERAGGLTRYVATLTDVGGEGGAGGGEGATFVLPSSRPVPCLASVGFGLVVPGRTYSVRVDGYDTSEIAPRAPGSPIMVAAAPDASPLVVAGAERVLPAWTTTCADATAVSVTIVRPASCAPLTPTGSKPPLPAELRVPTTALLGRLECGTEAGQVDRFSLSADFGDGERTLDVACDAAEEAVFSDVPAGVSAALFVSAFSVDGTEPFAGAACRAFTVPNASVTATCAPLSEFGTVRVDLAAALSSVGLDCSADAISDLTVTVPGESTPRSFAPPDCLQPLDLGSPPGAAALTLTAYQGDDELASLSCFADVTPGRLAVAICEENAAP